MHDFWMLGDEMDKWEMSEGTAEALDTCVSAPSFHALYLVLSIVFLWSCSFLGGSFGRHQETCTSQRYAFHL
jgi:hypothetical protein